MRTRTKVIITATAIIALLAFLITRNKITMNAQPAGSAMNITPSVAVAPVVKQVLSERIPVVGTVNAFNDVTVLSETQGRVIKVNVEVGDAVKAGTVLVEVDSELKEAAFKAAQVTYEKAKKDLARYEALYKEHSIPDAQIEQARWSFQSAESQYIVARRQLSDTKITSPIAGIVTARPVNLGSMVMGAPQATQIANVVDLSRLKAKVNVSEQDVFKLRKGAGVEVTSDVFPAVTFAGTIFSISSKCDDAHTYPVEVIVADPQHQLKAGMFVRLTFHPVEDSPLLLVPRVAIVGSMQEPKVFVVSGNLATLRSVLAVKQIGTQVALSSGVREGETVVVDGQNNLTDSLYVQVRK
jgi:RND family efflux transporter MFP subunit